MKLPRLFVSSYIVRHAFAALQAATCPWPALELSLTQGAINSEGYEPLYSVFDEVSTEWRSNHGRPENEVNSWKGPATCKGKYCVWANEAFGDEGFSMVTTFANSRQIQNRTMSTNTAYRSPLFRTIEIPGKGLGMVATGTIRRGERILAAQPAVLVHRNVIDEIGLEDQHQLLDAAAAQLPPRRRAQFLAQAGELGGHRTTDVMFTNSFQVHLGGQEGRHFGNFPEVSRFNHDCRPK